MRSGEVLPNVIRRRRAYLAATLATIAAGLLWRWPGWELPVLASKYGGSVLWGTMVFFVVATAWPALRLGTVAGMAAVLSASVEFSQAIHIGWLDAFRSHAFGRLLLGQTFTWWDIVAYWAGIIVAALTCRAVLRPLTPPSPP